jgi:hypothetical protein
LQYGFAKKLCKDSRPVRLLDRIRRLLDEESPQEFDDEIR